MNRQKLHNHIEYIKAQPEFPFDLQDIDDGIEPILAHYRIPPYVDNDERHVLRSELRRIASDVQLAESARTVEVRDCPELSWIPEAPPGYHPKTEPHEDPRSRAAARGPFQRVPSLGPP